MNILCCHRCWALVLLHLKSLLGQGIQKQGVFWRMPEVFMNMRLTRNPTSMLLPRTRAPLGTSLLHRRGRNSAKWWKMYEDRVSRRGLSRRNELGLSRRNELGTVNLLIVCKILSRLKLSFAKGLPPRVDPFPPGSEDQDIFQSAWREQGPLRGKRM